MLIEKEALNYDLDVDLVGISYRIAAEKEAFKIAGRFRSKNKTVVFGGPQPTAVPYLAKEHANAVVVGEGELLWPVLLEDFKTGNLKDFYVCPPNKINNTNYRVFNLDYIPDLSKHPMPNRQISKNKYVFDMVYASRGCPINCDFCLVSDIFGKKCRFRNIDDVVHEISTFKNYYYLIDETVFGRSGSYEYYKELYEKIYKLPRRKYWTGQANLDAASNPKGREIIRKAARSGLVYAAIGIESINKNTLISSGSFAKMGLKKSEDHLEILEKNIALIQNEGISISGWFAIGYESDSIQTYYDTVDFCIKNHIFPMISPVQALPGSRLYKKLNDKNKLQNQFGNITNVIHTSIKDTDIIKALEYSFRKGFTISRIIKNTFFCAKKIKKAGNSFNETIHKSIFIFATQNKLKKIVRQEIKRMRKKIGKKNI